MITNSDFNEACTAEFLLKNKELLRDQLIRKGYCANDDLLDNLIEHKRLLEVMEEWKQKQKMFELTEVEEEEWVMDFCKMMKLENQILKDFQ